MPLYRYHGPDAQGAPRRGLLRAADAATARAAVAAAGLPGARVRRYRGLPPWPLLVGMPLVLLVIVATLVQLGRLTARKHGWYGELARAGVTAPGTIAEAVPAPAGTAAELTWRYTFDAGAAGTRAGTISSRRTLSLTPGQVGLREFGAEPKVGDAVTVTYLPGRPEVCVPFPMTAERRGYPLRQVAGTALMLLLLLAILVVMAQRHLLHEWPERRLAQDAAAWPEGALRELPEPPPPPGRTPAAALPPGPWPGIGLLATCLGGYLALGMLGWWLALAGRGSPVEALQLAVGLGFLAVPAVLTCLAMRANLALTLGAGLVAMATHGLWLWLQAAHDPGMALTLGILRQYPGGILAGWLVPVLAMVALGRWPRLLARLGRAKPLWHDDGE